MAHLVVEASSAHYLGYLIKSTTDQDPQRGVFNNTNLHQKVLIGAKKLDNSRHVPLFKPQ